MHRARTLATSLAALVTAIACSRAQAAAPRYPDIMPLSQVKAGMKGYGLTVFRGTAIEKFAVRVVGVVKKGSLVVPGHDMILVKMYGGPMTTRKANLIRGMSGSPVYINGKIIGAFSQGEPMTVEPLGGVTPIEDMLEAWDPKLPDTVTARRPDNEAHTLQLASPITTGGRTIRKVVYNVPMGSDLRSHGSTLVLHPCTTFMSFSGLSGTARTKLKKALEPYHVELMDTPGAGRKPDFKGAPLVPGSAFSMMLITGDLSAGATGTVSYRRGERLLGFGHPFMGIGPIQAPLCSAWVYDVYPLLSGSYKISSPGPVVGSSTQDRNFSVSGILGKSATTIPVTVDVKDLTTGRGRVFHMQTVAHPELYASLVSSAVSAAITEIRSTPGAAMARVTTTVDADEVGSVTRSNVVFDSSAVDGAATADLDDLLTITSSNPFYPIGIKSANVKVEIESAHRTAQIDRIFLKEGRFEPGETVEIGVVVKPYKQPPVTRTVKLTIPSNTPSGRYTLIVRGGAVPAAINLGGIILRPAGGGQQEQLPPTNIAQMVKRYNEREKNNDLVTRLVLPTTAVSVDGEKLSNLPPSLDLEMRSAKSSGVRMERDEVKVVDPTDWVISGAQALQINVQRKDIQEAPVGGTPQGAQPGMAPPPTAPSSGQGFDRDFSTDNEESVTFAAEDASFARAQAAKPAAAPAKGAAKPTAPAGKPDGLAGPPAGGSTAPGGSETATPAPQDKPVGRASQVWRQTTRADFAKGTPHGVAVSTQGNLVLTRLLHKVQSSSETFMWSLISDGKGGFFAGTGTQGRVLRVAPEGTVSVFATLPEVSVHSLLLTGDGGLLAGTGPNGRVYKIDASGKSTVLFTADKARYALALARDSHGNVFVGTGGGDGAVYEIPARGDARLFYRTPEEHVLALAVDADDNVYAGTASDGLVYRIAPDGTARAIMDPPEQSVTALALNSKGELYATTAPRGVIYKVGRDGMMKTLFDRSAAAFTALAAGPGDVMFAAAGNGIYSVQPDDTILAVDNATDVEILSLAVGPHGNVYAGTGNTADIYSTGGAGSEGQHGTYESLVHDAKSVAQWGSIRWHAFAPQGARLSVETRTGSVAEPDSTWSPWAAPRMDSDGGRITSPAGRFIQYRVTLDSSAQGASPMLRDITVTYLPKNQAPRVSFQSPAGGEQWSRQQTLRWSADDPDKDTLSYELFYSPDFGTHWLPLPAGQTTTSTSTAPGAAAPVRTAQKPPSVAEVTAELDKHPDLPAAMRQAVLSRTQKLNEEYAANSSGGNAPASTGSAPSVIRETSRQLDTNLLPDGTYTLKVVATDRPSNPTDTQTTEAVSEPFVVCNAQPAVYLLAATQKVNTDHTVALQGVAVQRLLPITAVQYRVDGGEWTAAIAADGLFDSPIETFTISTTALTKGSHTLEVKAFNPTGVTAADKTTVEIK